jgi:hypothetical protein
MSSKLVFVKGLSSVDLIPTLQEWFSNHGYEVYTVANRIDAVMSSVTLKILLEDYGKGCTVNISGPVDHVRGVISYLSEISKFGHSTTQCEYCGVAFSTEQEKCPNCGAFRRLRRT